MKFNSINLQTWIYFWKQISENGYGVDVYNELVLRYSERHRKYHTLQHLGECLDLFSEVSTLSNSPSELYFAIWFHDAIYDIHSRSNEEDSASLVLSSLEKYNIDPSMLNRIGGLVMMTKNHTEPRTTNEKLLIDIDLSILGATPDRFCEFELQIRDEYSHIPTTEFIEARKTILEKFNSNNDLYNIDYFKDKFGLAAKRNLDTVLATYYKTNI